MVPREAMDAAQAAAVMVRVHGPDPKRRKMRNHAFHHSESGDTTLSASGLLLRNRLVHKKSNEADSSSTLSAVVTCASIIEPFLLKALSRGSVTELQKAPDLIPGAEVDILLEGLEQNSENCVRVNGSVNDNDKHSSYWLPAKLVCLVDIPSAGTALQALLDAHGGSVDGPWEVGWALAPTYSSPLQGSGALSHIGSDTPRKLSKSDGSHTFTGSENLGNNLAMATTRIAVLSICSPEIKIDSGLILAEPSKRGDFLLVVGSPFGALSPLHFFNSMAVGIVANCWPPECSQASLLMADVRCLPGMEGAPAFNKHGAFVGMLARPLRQRAGGAEVQLVITWEALAPALRDIGINLHGDSVQAVHGYTISTSFKGRKNEATKANFCHVRLGQHECSHSGRSLGLSAIDETVRSVVLVTVGDGAWASGILVNDKGLILTNAHLLEPWRFGKTQSAQSQNERELSVLENTTQTGIDFKDWFLISENCITNSNSTEGLDRFREHTKLPFSVGDLDSQTSVQLDEILNHAMNGGVVAPPALEINYRSYRKIRVRLEHPLPRSWRDAKVVYVSRGPLDIALLQLDSVPAGLLPIKPEEQCPLPGTTAVVIGHGLFGPRSELFPSISAGVVSRVVKAGNVSQDGFSQLEELPAMLETTAAVHPGGSGGAVVSERGCMIGLVTSNARHSGGTVIPHLNFSIPYAALKPIFKYASGDMKDFAILSALSKPNERLAAVWALVPPTPPRPTQPLPFFPKLPSNDNPTYRQKTETNLQKGSRFAKFLSDKKVELFKPLQPTQESSEQISKKWLLDNLPSKISMLGHVFHSRM